jgi:hypothetical protein
MDNIELHPAFADLQAATGRMKADADTIAAHANDMASCIVASVGTIDEALDGLDALAKQVDMEADAEIEAVNARRSQALHNIQKAQDKLVKVRTTFTAAAPASTAMQQAAE